VLKVLCNCQSPDNLYFYILRSFSFLPAFFTRVIFVTTSSSSCTISLYIYHFLFDPVRQFLTLTLQKRWFYFFAQSTGVFFCFILQISLAITGMNAVCPVFFKLISLIEQYHPRVALYWELTRHVFCISHTSLLPQLKLLLTP